MASSLSFAGRVAVITGAGGGLGREYALEFARRGASVVVNDLGGTWKGEGKSTSLADGVVEEIRKAGGKAVANYDSVENGENIINTAISNFGKIDILVNNAGILRDRSFVKMKEEDWDKVFQVHVKGAFKVTKAAWPHMRKQKFGRVIMTSSPSGLYGNFGQTNYSSAKLALVGFANTLAKEGVKSNIFVNVIAPVAETRMTADIMPPVGLLPKYICPFVVYMCHDSFKETGQIVETAGGYACKTALFRSSGFQVRTHVGDTPSVEVVANSWDKISDFSDIRPTKNTEASTMYMESIQDLPEHPIPENGAAHEKLMAYRASTVSCVYTAQDAILYALGIGASVPNDSKFLYEGHPDFSVFPTMGAVISQKTTFNIFTSGIPGLEEINVANVLHGEQYTEVFSPIPPGGGKLSMKTYIADVRDKRKFCQMILHTDVYDEKGEKLIHNQMVVLFMGTSGVGMRGKSTVQIPSLPAPKRSPDAVCEETVPVNQAALYRLNGDQNPLHIDPEFASTMGFKQPILHGLCSFGYSTRHVMKTFANNDVSLFKSVKAQFSKPVLPGQTLQTEMWVEGRRIHFQTKVKETGIVVIKGAYVDLNGDPKTNKPVSAPTTGHSGATNSLKAAKIMGVVKDQLKENPDLAKRLKGAFFWQITKDKKVAGEWLTNFNISPPQVTEGNADGVKPDVELQLDDDVFEMLAEGKMTPTLAFMQGKIKAKGKIMLAQRLGEIFKSARSKL